MDNRRTFLKKAALLTGGLSLWETLPPSIQKALAINPAAGSTYLDAEHIVFLMQENRSFDHAYGTLKGVRGFNDPRAITLPNGNPVWLQPDRAENFAPFHHDIHDTQATWMHSLPHSWSNQHDARHDGKFDRWIEAKRGAFPDMPMTMGYYNRGDIPFYYDLADAFTVCDQNFCSSLTGTTPNRLHFWTGTIRGSQDASAPARVRNEETDYPREAQWTTYPERLEAAGITWKVYQNEISWYSGLDDEFDSWLTNFGDNPLEWFSQFKVRFSPESMAYYKAYAEKLQSDTTDKGKARLKEVEGILATYNDTTWAALSAHEKNLHRKAFTNNREDPDYRHLTTHQYQDGDTQRYVQVPKGDVFHQFRQDVEQGTLPAVSWLVPPEHYSDHPSSAWYGTWYLSETLDILTKNPEVWKKTIFILTYDENDGSFDHIPPFTAPHPHRDDTGKVSAGIDTRPEYVTLEEDRLRTNYEEAREGSIGLGFRVPMVIASPWTRGGWVNSEVFDHTSSLRFLESFIQQKWRKQVQETNISTWRRTVAGDLTSVFRPYNGEPIAQPPFQQKDTVIESIHRARFKSLPDNCKNLTPEDIALIRKNPRESPYLPVQEKGTKPSNALAYELYADGKLDKDSGNFILTLESSKARFGAAALGGPFNVYAPGFYLQVPMKYGKYEGAPVMESVKCWSYAVSAGDKLTDQFPLSNFGGGGYHLHVYGPNGYYREFKGNAGDPDVAVRCTYTPSGGLAIAFVSSTPYNVQAIDNAYGRGSLSGTTASGLTLGTVQGWYDVSIKIAGFESFEARYAGRVETGMPSITDPFMGGMV